jgi:hypothetical protein
MGDAAIKSQWLWLFGAYAAGLALVAAIFALMVRKSLASIQRLLWQLQHQPDLVGNPGVPGMDGVREINDSCE